LGPDTFLERYSKSSEQMLESINRSTERLEAVVSDMEEISEALLQVSTKAQEVIQEMT